MQAFIHPSVVVVFCLCLLSVDCNGACRFPPSLWCSSRLIARECKVEDQCEANVWSESIDAPKVNFALYHETLCPDCKKFINEQLTPTFFAVSEIFSLDLVPYGNAREHKVGDKWVFTCQHGPTECFGNLIQTCAIHIVGNMSMVYPFIACMEESEKLPNVSAPECAKQHGVDYRSLTSCANSDLGNKLEHEMAVKTEQLDPPHTWVPWVTLNGVHTDAIQKAAETDLLKLICDTYMGPKPHGCQEVTADHKCPY